MTRVPVPRYDLLKAKDYLFGSVQFSRLSIPMRILRHHRHVRSSAETKRRARR